jgi:hypothetical protein
VETEDITTRTGKTSGKPYSEGWAHHVQVDEADLIFKVLAFNGVEIPSQQTATLLGTLGYEEKEGERTPLIFVDKTEKFDPQRGPRDYVKLTVRVFEQPELKYSQNGRAWCVVKAFLSMGKDAQGNYKPSFWLRLKAFAKETDGGEFDESLPLALNNLGKGDLVTVGGSLMVSYYEDRAYYEVIARQLEAFAPTVEEDDLPF